MGVAPGGQVVNPRFGPCDEEPLKNRMRRAVASLGRAEVEDIIRTEGKIEVTCEFCNQVGAISGYVHIDISPLVRLRSLTLPLFPR